MKALIFENKVIQIEQDENVFEVHPSMQWVDCINSVEVDFDYDGTSFSAPAGLSSDELLMELRTERNRLLAETDYWTLSDTPDATDAQLAYRIELRNIPLTYTSLDDVVWPEKP